MSRFLVFYSQIYTASRIVTQILGLHCFHLAAYIDSIGYKCTGQAKTRQLCFIDDVFKLSASVYVNFVTLEAFGSKWMSFIH